MLACNEFGSRLSIGLLSKADHWRVIICLQSEKVYTEFLNLVGFLSCLKSLSYMLLKVFENFETVIWNSTP